MPRIVRHRKSKSRKILLISQDFEWPRSWRISRLSRFTQFVRIYDVRKTNILFKLTQVSNFQRLNIETRYRVGEVTRTVHCMLNIQLCFRAPRSALIPSLDQCVQASESARTVYHDLCGCSIQCILLRIDDASPSGICDHSKVSGLC